MTFQKNIITALLILLTFVKLEAQNNENSLKIKDGGLKLITKNTAVYIDKTNKLDIYEVSNSTMQDKFKKYNKDVFIFPPSENTIWIKFTISNLSNETLWLEAGGSYSIWEINFYTNNNTSNNWEIEKKGALRKQKEQNTPKNFYWFKIATKNKKQAKTYYLKVKSGVAIELPIYVGSYNSLSKKRIKFLCLPIFLLV